jgi:GNAT superfamily N-acetyltransferase
MRRVRYDQVHEPVRSLLFETARFATRPAVLADAAGIAVVQAASWRTSYRGILPDAILDGMDATRRVARRRDLITGFGLNLVAYDTTHRDIVGYCHAGPSRRDGRTVGELYEIYLVDRAKRYGLGRELFTGFVDWCRNHGMASMVVWVLENNQHARRFYEALGGRAAMRVQSSVSGFPVVELSYVWPRLPARR